MPSQLTGFLVNTTTPSVSSTFDLNNKVTLSFGSSTQDPLSSRPPKNICTFGRLVVELDNAAGVSQVEAYLTFDAAGDHLAAGPFVTTTFMDALSTTTPAKRSVAFGMDQWVAVWPSDADGHPTLYLFLKQTGGAPGFGTDITVTKAYLYWRQLAEAM